MDYYVIFSTLFFYYTKIFPFFMILLFQIRSTTFWCCSCILRSRFFLFFARTKENRLFFYIYIWNFLLYYHFIRFSQFLFLIQFKTNLISKFGLNTVKNFTHLISFSQTPPFLFFIWESTFFSSYNMENMKNRIRKKTQNFPYQKIFFFQIRFASKNFFHNLPLRKKKKNFFNSKKKERIFFLWMAKEQKWNSRRKKKIFFLYGRL